jgi:hypothetical protein
MLKGEKSDRSCYCRAAGGRNSWLLVLLQVKKSDFSWGMMGALSCWKFLTINHFRVDLEVGNAGKNSDFKWCIVLLMLFM